MTASAQVLLTHLRQAGATLTCSPDGRVHFAASAPLPAALLAEARAHREAIATALSSEDPVGACGTCSGGLWWRLSVMSGGPGPWQCSACCQPDPNDWIDASAVPTNVNTGATNEGQ